MLSILETTRVRQGVGGAIGPEEYAPTRDEQAHEHGWFVAFARRPGKCTSPRTCCPSLRPSDGVMSPRAPGRIAKIGRGRARWPRHEVPSPTIGVAAAIFETRDPSRDRSRARNSTGWSPGSAPAGVPHRGQLVTVGLPHRPAGGGVECQQERVGLRVHLQDHEVVPDQSASWPGPFVGRDVIRPHVDAAEVHRPERGAAQVVGEDALRAEPGDDKAPVSGPASRSHRST